MDEHLRNMIKENNRLLRETVEHSKDTNDRIKKIHAIMRRTFWSRIGYWVLLLLITAGAFYAVIPTINNFIEKYPIINSLDITKTSDSNEMLEVIELFFMSEDDTAGSQ